MDNLQDLSLTDILTPTQYTIYQIGNISSYIESKYGNFLVSPTKGIYRYGERKPIIEDGKAYYVKNTKTDEVFQLNSMSQLQSGMMVFDYNNKLILTEFDIVNKERLLTNTPTVPTVGYELVKGLLESYILKKNSFTRDYWTVFNKLYKFINDQSNNEILSTISNDRCFESIEQQLDDFVGKDVNHVYFFKPIGISDVVVEKTIDWRAYQWHLSQQNLTD